ncbi:DUF3021 domain-containing protein [Streptococcus sp. HF-1907]|uniref:DUF3021 domain-containing protein n=1 Tax=Streptococcus sp. HF-1907 TaxID=2785793 RepID=UPI00189F355E|nr:DUF3021 domain-containing protein [Streptococcus sp. HF-1907]MBF7094746.1 DUF3021 domain-containing protein [Streptococcus sp. HF-1907]
MKKLINSFIVGVGIGDLISCLLLASSHVGTLSLANVFSVAIFSGIIGIISYILFDWMDAPLQRKLLIHFIVVMGIIYAMYHFNDWIVGNPLIAICRFAVIYGLIWLFVRYMIHQRISKINQKLQERRQLKK